MTFYRYRWRDHSGHEPWNYIDYNTGDRNPKDCIVLVKEYLEEEEHWRLYDGYRGIDIEHIQRPPDEWLQKQIKCSLESIAYHSLRARTYERLLGITDGD